MKEDRTKMNKTQWKRIKPGCEMNRRPVENEQNPVKTNKAFVKMKED